MSNRLNNFLTRFVNEIDNWGHFERNLLMKHFDLVKLATCDFQDTVTFDKFFYTLREKLIHIYMHVADIEAGDNLCLQAVPHFSRDNLQNQLNIHHFQAKSKRADVSDMTYIDLRNKFCNMRQNIRKNIFDGTNKEANSVINISENQCLYNADEQFVNEAVNLEKITDSVTKGKRHKTVELMEHGNSNFMCDGRLENIKFENIINLLTVKDVWRKKSSVLWNYKSGNMTRTFGHPENIAEIIVHSWITSRHLGNETHLYVCYDAKNIRKGLEGLILLQNLLTAEGSHNVESGRSTMLIALSMAVYSGRKATDDPLSPLTRNGISAILPPHCTIAETMYEDCVNKLERRIRFDNFAIDNLQHPLSRLVCGLPTKLGVTSFDIISKSL